MQVYSLHEDFAAMAACSSLCGPRSSLTKAGTLVSKKMNESHLILRYHQAVSRSQVTPRIVFDEMNKSLDKISLRVNKTVML
jgi:hypothetical protein